MVQVKSLINCRVYVSFKPLRVANALTIVGDRVFYVGDAEKAVSIARSLGGEVIDLSGLIVMPGFIDSHMHLDSLGLNLNTLDLRGSKSIEEVKERLREFVAEGGPTEWVVGRGWDQELFAEGRWLSRWDIDEVVRDKPALLIRVCGHVGVVNSKAIEVIKKHLGGSLKPPYFDINEKGELTGIVRESGLEEVLKLVTYGSDQLLKFLEDAINHTLRQGVTTVGLAGCSSEVLTALQVLKSLGKLRIRVRAYLNRDLLPYLRNLGIRCGFGDSRLKVLGIKVFTDGSLGARTALLSKPYADDPSTSGVATISEAELIKVVKEASEAGLQLAVHAIGDKAIDMVLKAYGEVGEYVRSLRHRIEHASVIRPKQVIKASELGVAIAIQPHFVISDWWVIDRVGAERAPWVYPFKSIIDAGLMTGFSTDAPVEPINPWETVYAAVTRGAYEGIKLYEFSRSEVLDAATALHHYTYGSAQLLHSEDEVGTLEVGKCADLIVIDRDPLKVSPEELRNVKVLGTMVGGEFTYASIELSTYLTSR